MSDRHEKLFLEAYEAHADAIFRYCYFKLSDRDFALDALQEIFMRLWKYMQEGHFIEHPQSFLFTVAANYVKDQWKKKKAVPMSRLESEENDQPFDVAAETDDIIPLAEYRMALERFALLSDEERQILQFRFVEGMAVKDIARILKERENTVAVKISRALAKLREDIKKHERRQ